MRAFLGVCAFLVACGPSPALEPALPPQTPAPHEAAPRSEQQTRPGGCDRGDCRAPGGALHGEESATISVSQGDLEEQVAVEVNRPRGTCKIEASAGVARRELATQATECEALFEKFHTLEGAWGSGGLGCEGCARFTIKHTWSSETKGAGSSHQKGAKAAFFPRRVDEQDQATGLYAEAGRLGRLAGASLALLPSGP